MTIEMIDEPIAISRSAVLTPLGHTVQSFYRFVKLLRELDPDQRAGVLEMVGLELEARPPSNSVAG
jgi:hypothetical protein